MRREFCSGLLEEASRSDFVFLTGDLGFGALEPLRTRMGDRFINAGVAEQNMISVATGLAQQGMRPWVYSIAPFIYARPFEQLRNGPCLHNLPIVIVGNGGGYGYGVMGGTHHAIEDYGVLQTLQNMVSLIPAFDADLCSLIPRLFRTSGPTYLRLGVSEQPSGLIAPPFAQWRKLQSGDGGTIIVVGPLAGGVWAECEKRPIEFRPNVWCLSELPVLGIPSELRDDLESSPRVTIAEEHVATGSAGQALAMLFLREHVAVKALHHITACGYPTGRYGSQKFHRAQCGLHASALLDRFADSEC